MRAIHVLAPRKVRDPKTIALCSMIALEEIMLQPF
jgi:hypothetical protein